MSVGTSTGDAMAKSSKILCRLSLIPGIQEHLLTWLLTKGVLMLFSI